LLVHLFLVNHLRLLLIISRHQTWVNLTRTTAAAKGRWLLIS